MYTGHGSRLTLHRALAAKSVGKLWLQRLQQAMCDLHRQHGWADYFITVAPFELTTPLSTIVESALHACGRHGRSLLALALHHIMSAAINVIKGYMLNPHVPGSTFGNKFAVDENNIAAWAVRQELQTGKRQADEFRREERPHRAQQYHGRRGVHWHIAVWARQPETVLFGNVARLRLLV